MTILLVDDEPEMLNIWEMFLKPLADELRRAHSVAEALEQMRILPPPDLVLLDLRMPPGTAEDTVASIGKFHALNPNLTVIATSGMSVEQIQRLVKHAHVHAVIAKAEITSQKRLLTLIGDAVVKSRGLEASSALLGKISSLLGVTV